MKQTGRAPRRRDQKGPPRRIGGVAIVLFIVVVTLAAIYGLQVNGNIERIWQEHLEWLHQQE